MGLNALNRIFAVSDVWVSRRERTDSCIRMWFGRGHY